MKFLLAPFLITSFISTASFSADDEIDGIKQNYGLNIGEIEKATYQGPPDAQFNLGRRYDGKEAEQNYAQAFEWFQKAGLQGQSVAQKMLIDMFSASEHVPTRLYKQGNKIS